MPNGVHQDSNRTSATDIPLTISSTTVESQDYLIPCGGLVGSIVARYRQNAKNATAKFSTSIQYSFKICLMSVFIVYASLVIKTYITSGASMDWCYGYGKAFIIIGLTVLIIIYNMIGQYFNINFIHNTIDWDTGLGYFIIKYGRFSLTGTFLFSFFIYATYEAINTNEPGRLISFLGILFFLLCGLIFSKYPEFIRWDTVLTGLALQIFMGLISIPIKFGRDVFTCVGNTVVNFLEYGYTGAALVYGDLLVNKEQILAFKGLSVLYFLSMIVQVLFYLGWLQIACLKIGRFIQYILGTTVIESVNSIATVFLGQSEAPLLYRAYINFLTPSEIHAVMSACFATVAGTMLAAYTSLGVDPKNVITASMMAAPGALAYAKLFYPETQKSLTSKTISLLKSEDLSVMDAACKGTMMAVGIVGAIIASVIACVSLMSLLNGVTLWLGYLVGIHDLTLDYILGIIFIPLAWIMGVKSDQCEDVASLIGIKTLANEFVAYNKLGKLKAAGKLSVRSEAIATFSLCGFANPGALATLIALLTSLAPNKRGTIIKIAFRALVTGSITSFSSGCIAGLLTPENGFKEF